MPRFERNIIAPARAKDDHLAIYSEKREDSGGR